MTDGPVEIASRGDEDRLLSTLELAFSSDPVMRWFWPEPNVYRTYLRRFALAVCGPAFDHGTAFSLDQGRVVALWLQPGVSADDDAITEVILESIDPGLLTDLSAFADMIRGHHVEVEHWYLPFIGVDPVAQGKGLGTRLLRHTLETCDRDGVPAYLEASTARSRALYESVGFEQVGAIQAGSSPTVWAMLRPPRPGSAAPS